LKVELVYSESLSRLLTTHCPCTLASFASAIVALDETTWDAVERHLPALRQFPKGDVGLRPGKIVSSVLSVLYFSCQWHSCSSVEIWLEQIDDVYLNDLFRNRFFSNI